MATIHNISRTTIRGTRLIPESTYDEQPLLSAWKVDNPKFARAMATFVIARGATETPCQVEPWIYESHMIYETLDVYAYRVRQAAVNCRGCPLFDRCQKLGDSLTVEKPEITGVVAGYLYDRSRLGIAVRRRLQMEEKKVLPDADLPSGVHDA